MKPDLSAITPKSVKNGLNYIRNKGISGVVSDLKYRLSGPGPSYDGWYKKTRAAEDLLEAQRNSIPDYAPLVSILVTPCNTTAVYLSEMLDSVCGQSYPYWELVIVDDGHLSENTAGSRDLSDIIRRYMDSCDRIKYIPADKDKEISGSECLNMAVRAAEGEYIALLSPNDVLSAEALYMMVTELNHAGADILYSDEDKLSEDGSRYSEPVFKPAFDIDMLRSFNYIGCLTIIKKKLVLQVGGFRAEYEGAHYYDLVLRCCEELWQVRWNAIRHVPYVLYHVRRRKDKNINATGEAIRRSIEAHLSAVNAYGVVSQSGYEGIYRVVYDTPGNPLLSIVIVGTEDCELMKKCILPLYERSRYSSFEIIVMDRYSDNEELGKFYRKIEGMRRNIRILPEKKDSRMTRLKTKGAELSNGDYILFLDAYSEVLRSTAIGEMLGICMRAEVGAVGGIMYGDNDRVYHSCYAVKNGSQLCDVYRGLKHGERSYMLRNCMNAEYSAVSGSCMMIRKALFRRVGGFSEKLNGEFSEVDLCLRIIEHGFCVVFAPAAEWHIHKSPEQVKNPESGERDLFNIFWGQYLSKGDPYLSDRLL